MKKRILFLLLTVVLLCGLSIPVHAAHPVPDLSQNGSLTFSVELDGTQLDGGALNLYRVGDIRENDGNYNFRLIEALQSRDLLPEEVSDPALAQDLLTRAKPLNLTKITAPIRNGKAVFDTLPVGLYLVWQSKADATDGYDAIHPFLISIPRFQNGEYILDVVATPKVPLETEPTEPTTPPPPPPPHLPQTGQLNWPIPIMAVSGAVLFVVGWILCAGRKRRDNEA